MNCYISKLEVSGNERLSSVEFTQGFNIITGPSNTGKTLIYKCIDFCLGADSNPLDNYKEYTQLTLYITSDNKKLSIERKINSNTVSINSDISDIPKGIYNIKTKHYTKSLNSVILKLLGITEEHKIVKNKNFDRQELTWRSFYHMFFIDEKRISANDSPLLKGDHFSETSSLSILIFLLYNEDFKHRTAYDRHEIKRAKKQAIENYINNEIENISKRTAQLETELKELSENDIRKRIDSIIYELENTQNIINKSIKETKNIVKKIYLKNESLIEDTMLLTHYKLLETQYKSDLSRLNFIVDGQIHYEKTEETDCPFCHNEISIKENPDYVSVSIHKYKKIKMQISDLANAMQDLENEIKQINNEIKILNDKKNKLDQEINEQLKPKIYELKNKLQIYENYIKKSNEIKILKDICADKNKYISDRQNIKSNNTNYDPKEYLLENMFFTEFSEMIKTILEKGYFENLNTISIDEKTVDVIINGQKKSDNGKGYRAYFNSMTSISLIRYLFEKAIYKPSILILDSPLLSLKLEENEESTQYIKQSIKDGMFEILTNFPNKLQTIVIENEIPEINDKSVNIIRFTKNKTTGRYGFLNEVYD